MTKYIDETFTSATTGTAVRIGGEFAVSIRGTFVGTVEIQRSYDEDGLTDFAEVFTVTAPQELNIGEPGKDCWYRFECTSFTSGSITCEGHQ